MKRWIIFIIWLTLPFAFADIAFNCSPKSKIQWQQIHEGVEWTQYDLAFTPYNKTNTEWDQNLSRSVTVRVLRIDISQVNLQFHRRTKKLDCNPASERMIEKLVANQNKNAIAAINSNFYIMNDGDILGLAIDQEKIWSTNLNNLNISSEGMMLINTDKVELVKKDIFVSMLNNYSLQELQIQNHLILQAYPRLLDQNQLQISDRVKDVKNSRTSIGVELNTNKLLLITIDAGGQNAQTGMSLFEYAHMLQSQNCGVAQEIALNLDGGGSTAFAIPSLNLYKQADRCRNLGNILTVLPKE